MNNYMLIFFCGTLSLVLLSACDDVNVGSGGGEFFAPSVSAVSVNDIGSDFVVISAEITSDGGAEVKERGVVWAKETRPTIDNAFFTSEGTGTGEFTSTISNLESETQYFIRAYATNDVGTTYGPEINITTNEAQTVDPPLVTTVKVEEINETSAAVIGNLVSDGGGTVTVKGFVWDIDNHPDINLETKTAYDGNPGEFSDTITELQPGTMYYVRAYAVNESGIAYGEVIGFTTEEIQTIDLPEVITVKVDEITENSTVVSGNLISDGGGTVTVKGFVWDINNNPEIGLETKTENGSSLGEYSTNVDNLQPETTYYIRAYATNEVGTAYGEQLVFTTLNKDEGEIPVVTTADVIGITNTGAISGGNVSSDGGLEVISRGVVWSLNPEPIVGSSSMTMDGSGRGSFVSVLTNLLPGTRYYIRAYATNEKGTSYGSQLEFMTQSD